MRIRLEQTLAIGVSMLAATSCRAPVPSHPMATNAAPLVVTEDDQPSGPAAPDARPARLDRPSGSLDPRRWRFASFFNGVEKQVAENWHPLDACQGRDLIGPPCGPGRNRYAEVRVELTPDGQLRSVDLVQTSGLEILDDEAITAFRKAVPFAAVPRRLVGDDGVVRFTFGFLYDLKGKPQPSSHDAGDGGDPPDGEAWPRRDGG
jgi:TonB family protein